jgi:hypothetical protein
LPLDPCLRAMAPYRGFNRGRITPARRRGLRRASFRFVGFSLRAAVQEFIPPRFADLTIYEASDRAPISHALATRETMS